MPQNFSLAQALAFEAGYTFPHSQVDLSQKMCKKCIAMKTLPCHGLLDYKIDTFDMQNSQEDQFRREILQSIQADKSSEENMQAIVDNLLNSTQQNKGGKVSHLNLELDLNSSTLYQRRLMMPFELFLGCIGGILALFTGFSFIVIVEFLYFVLWRSYEDWNDPVLNPQNFASNLDKSQPRSNSDPDLT